MNGVAYLGEPIQCPAGVGVRLLSDRWPNPFQPSNHVGLQGLECFEGQFAEQLDVVVATDFMNDLVAQELRPRIFELDGRTGQRGSHVGEIIAPSFDPGARAGASLGVGPPFPIVNS